MPNGKVGVESSGKQRFLLPHLLTEKSHPIISAKQDYNMLNPLSISQIVSL